ncbi:MAG TPA: hypothetical protein VK158_05545 [Acidobacteriota bacterium]|nr:hypothetical protein [Acidobacteriota bacterium]
MDLPPPPPQPQPTFFSQPRQMPNTGLDTISQVNSLGRRMRMIEETVSNLRRKAELDEQNNLKSQKRTSEDIQMLTSDIEEMSHQLKAFKDDMIKIIKELQNTAKKEDVITLEKYINLWQPIQFVTQKEVQGIVEYEIDRRMQALNLNADVKTEHERKMQEPIQTPELPQRPAKNEVSFEKPLFSPEEAPMPSMQQEEELPDAQLDSPDVSPLGTHDFLRSIAEKIQSGEKQNKDKKDLHELL